MRHSLLPVGLALCALTLGCPGDDGEPAGGTMDPSTGSSGGSTDGVGSSTDGSLDDTGTDSSTGGTTELPEPLPPLDGVPTTVEERIEPTHVIETTPTLDPRIPELRQQLLDEGYGELELAPGEPVVDLTPGGRAPLEPGPGAAMVSRFVHLADTQIADDESPLRLVEVDSLFISGAFRPQETHGCQITNAAVRTINAVHAQTPLDFVVLGGDNADSAQTNEVQWFLDILDGAPVVHCDSGDDDDLQPGPDNDPKDRFAPVGLDVPWIWVSGNHDVLVQGNFTPDTEAEAAVGSAVPPGSSTRDWSMPGGPVSMGPVVADPQRALVDTPALLELVVASGDGHGIDAATIASGRATYAWDLAGTDLRIVVVDSTAPSSDSNGVITDTDVEERVRPLLDAAEAEGKLVLVSSHHASGTLTDGSGLGGDPVPGALDPADWRAFLADYPNVLAHLCGHSHVHQAEYIQPMGTRGYWEVITAAIADWPHQMRVVEVHDQDNGWLTITGIALDYATEDDALAADARALGILDFTSNWVIDGAGMPQDRNVRLWVAAP
ncbi:MAG: metallophosphoesterase [Nannocystaceae bacterium]